VAAIASISVWFANVNFEKAQTELLKSCALNYGSLSPYFWPSIGIDYAASEDISGASTKELEAQAQAMFAIP
jgi:hypothetical protein